MPHDFCESCNRVRVSATGILYTCLGQEERTDRRSALWGLEGDDLLHAAIARAIELKPKGHDFAIGPDQTPLLGRRMSALGGGAKSVLMRSSGS